MTNDIRWHQRLTNFESALKELTDAVNLTHKRPLSKLEEQGLIQSFEYNYELAWNCMKDYFENQGDTELAGSRDAIRLAFKRGLIANGESWMEMIKSRVSTSRTYNKAIATQIAQKIIDEYYPEFVALHKKLTSLKNKS
ncbi:MAG TPA: nucleotidyltransferase substrate binding protein [Coxiellaceae bacterium]|nr:MAG: nucleotidyltransferase [Gammaproteobacteria bacterium RIFCSPHIGHO2_12_FULL_42_13]HLD84551.1 nucleotidyltransferase substrate binding protein [Coxiellaceae bacterium]